MANDEIRMTLFRSARDARNAYRTALAQLPGRRGEFIADLARMTPTGHEVRFTVDESVYEPGMYVDELRITNGSGAVPLAHAAERYGMSDDTQGHYRMYGFPAVFGFTAQDMKHLLLELNNVEPEWFTAMFGATPLHISVRFDGHCTVNGIVQ